MIPPDKLTAASGLAAVLVAPAELAAVQVELVRWTPNTRTSNARENT
ncbi:hypothetical protein OG223_03395 [Streptomyces sp. NBC_01478]|nr:hypothetical protein [Streptomyces sp. NBC_01478]